MMVEMLQISLLLCRLGDCAFSLPHSCFTTGHGHTMKLRGSLLFSSLHPAAVAARVVQDNFTSFLPPQVALLPDL